jgi:hypothetical protein
MYEGFEMQRVSTSATHTSAIRVLTLAGATRRIISAPGVTRDPRISPVCSLGVTWKIADIGDPGAALASIVASARFERFVPADIVRAFAAHIGTGWRTARRTHGTLRLSTCSASTTITRSPRSNG